MIAWVAVGLAIKMKKMMAKTFQLTRMLPKPLREWFRGNFAYHDWIGFAVVEYDELLRIWPEGACNQDDVRMAQLQDRTDNAPPRLTSMYDSQ